MNLDAVKARLRDLALRAARQWWRPVACWGVSGAIVINGIVIPLRNGTATDLTGLAALVASLFPFVIGRSLEKMKGVADNA